MKSIFLSASIPVAERDARFMETVDVIAIRDAVIELVKVCINNQIRIVWGGHPAITPLVYEAISANGRNDRPETLIHEYVHLFQSRFFEKYFPADNNRFNNVFIVESEATREQSLLAMRRKMLSAEKFIAGVFIGGMEGVEAEYQLFAELHPQALLMPVASTGAAALSLYLANKQKFDSDLIDNYAYNSLFCKYLCKEGS